MTDGQAWPSWRRIAAVVPAGACYEAAAAEAIKDLSHHAGWNWSRMVGSGAGWAISMVGFAALLRLAAHQRDAPDDVQRAIDAGRLPEDGRLDDWVPRLAGRIRQLRRLRLAVVALLVLLTALVAAAALVANDGDWTVDALAVVLAAFVVVPFHWIARRIRRAIQLLDSLGSAQPRT